MQCLLLQEVVGVSFYAKACIYYYFYLRKKEEMQIFFNAVWSALNNNNSGLSFGQFKKRAQSLVCSKFRLWLSI